LKKIMDRPAWEIACAAFVTTLATSLVVGGVALPSRSKTSSMHSCSLPSFSSA
jgi:hypothetical protein